MIKQCKWECSCCGSRCGGVLFHSGKHQCPICYKAFNCLRCGERVTNESIPNKIYISLEKISLCGVCVE